MGNRDNTFVLKDAISTIRFVNINLGSVSEQALDQASGGAFCETENHILNDSHIKTV